MSSAFTWQSWTDKKLGIQVEHFWVFFCIPCAREFCNMWSKGHFETLLCPSEKCLMILYAHKTLKHSTAQRELTESTHDVIQCTGHSKATFQIKFWSTTSKTNLTYKQGRDGCWDAERSKSERRNMFNPKTLNQHSQQSWQWFCIFTFWTRPQVCPWGRRGQHL